MIEYCNNNLKESLFALKYKQTLNKINGILVSEIFKLYHFTT